MAYCTIFLICIACRWFVDKLVVASIYYIYWYRTRHIYRCATSGVGCDGATAHYMWNKSCWSATINCCSSHIFCIFSALFCIFLFFRRVLFLNRCQFTATWEELHVNWHHYTPKPSKSIGRGCYCAVSMHLLSRFCECVFSMCGACVACDSFGDAVSVRGCKHQARCFCAFCMTSMPHLLYTPKKNMTQYTKAVHNPCRTTMPIIQLEPFWGGAFSAKNRNLKI